MTERGSLPVSVVIPVLNEEANLPRCLAALGRFAEIIVVDSGSSDRTVAVAESAGARVLHFAWNGRYPKKRNWVLLTQSIASPWVLFLDADEFIDDRFCSALASAIRGSNHSGFWLRYTNYFLGRRLRFGVAQRKLALVRFGHALYERVEEEDWSSLDMEVHEHPVLDGSAGEIAVPIEHNEDRGMARFLGKHLDYAKWEARRYVALRKAGSADRRLTARQKTKYRFIGKWWYSAAYFTMQYVFKGGFLDGRAGLQYALLKFWYFLTVYVLIRERAATDR